MLFRIEYERETGTLTRLERKAALHRTHRRYFAGVDELSAP
jgi:hypothetical protein